MEMGTSEVQDLNSPRGLVKHNLVRLASHISNTTLTPDHHSTATMPNLPDPPCELRLEIYRALFASLLVLDPVGDFVNTGADLIRDARPLLATNRQVAREAAEVSLPDPALSVTREADRTPYPNQGWTPGLRRRRRRCKGAP